MKNFILFFIINLVINCYAIVEIQASHLANPPIGTKVARKKILVLSTKGGGGNTCAANAVASYLEKDYDITVVNVICDVFGCCNSLKPFSYAEDCYNFLLKHRCNFLINFYNYCGLFTFKLLKTVLTNVLYTYIKSHKFDMLISMTQYINGVALDAAKKLDIPFLVITTDLNTATFAHDISDPNYKKFNYLLPFEDELLTDKIAFAKIPKDKIKFIGYPLREDFFECKDANEIKKKWGIPTNKPIAMVLMGSIGSTATFMYAYRLSKYKKPLHIIICLGKGEWLREKIKRIKFPPHITVSLVGFTNKISDLMAVSDVLITKTGSHSVCEAMQSKVPLILDSINPSLEWEDLNPVYIDKHQFGENLTDYQDIYDWLDKVLKDKKYKDNLLSQRVYNFSHELKKLISGFFD
ncbi:MAG: glycosyltransferase [Candidatus Babeliales bacterium]|nr:glycosyltransferase [Candidatus Babeliales bacterium]